MDHDQYFKSVLNLSEIDVYRVLDLYQVTHPCIQHAIKKLLCAGKRGIKDEQRDVNEALLSLHRYNQMQAEDGNTN